MSRRNAVVRARRGWGLERQRAHRAKQSPPLSDAEAVHMALVEAVAAGQREQAESESTSARRASGASVPTAALSAVLGALVAADHAVTPRLSRGDAARPRDPRLGSYRNVGSFLEHVWKRLGLTREQVLAIAGVDEPEALLDFEGVGLRALYAACAEKARAA